MAKFAIISDIHSNYEALEVVLAACAEARVDKYLCLGDIVGYNADPQKCLERVLDLDLIAMVRGNHDDQVASDDEEMDGFNQNARIAILWTRQQLTAEQRAWLGTPPLRMAVPGIPVTLVHATLDSPAHWGYVFDVHHAKDNFSYQFTQLCFCGHSHVPVAFDKRPMTGANEKTVVEITNWSDKEHENDGTLNWNEADSLSVQLEAGHKYLFNIGSVGQPRNHDPRASFAIFDDIDKTVTRYRIPYDISATQAKIRAAGLPERLAARLESGI